MGESIGGDIDFSFLDKINQYPGDTEFKIDGMNANDYIDKLTSEMNAIDIESIPFDKWDYIIAFSLALIEVAGDFFIGDPAFKHSLANKNGAFCKWLNQFHKHASGSPLDFQGNFDLDGNLIPRGESYSGEVISYSGWEHRAKTFGHDSLPLSRLLYGTHGNDDDGSAGKNTKKVYNGVLWARDIIGATIAIYSIKSGTFIDCAYTGDGSYKIITSTCNQYGNDYDSCGLFTAIFRYIVHLSADFCSSCSLPIPGTSILTHWPDREVQEFAIDLYKNGMNMRTMLLGGVPVAIVEILMRIYIHCRYKDSEYTKEQQQNKLKRMLLITHGITSAVNVGKVIISKNPARLNIILIARTVQLVWQVVSEEMKKTNKAIEKLDMGILCNRIESMQTLILLDKAIYITSNYNRLIAESQERVAASIQKEIEAQNKFNDKIAKLKAELED